jgi:catechol 2,3-dioxygenase-like lactoylglutathione lyase family enzyme
MDILSSRILLRPSDLDRSRRFYGDALGMAVYREFGPRDDPGGGVLPGQGLLEVSGHEVGHAGRSVMIWIQVRNIHAERARPVGAAVRIIREPATEPWGLAEIWIQDPDGIRIVLVEVPAITLSGGTRDRLARTVDVAVVLIIRRSWFESHPPHQEVYRSPRRVGVEWFVE